MTPGKKTSAFLLILLVTAGFSTSAIKAQTFTFETWSNANTPVMTVTAFRSVTVDLLGKVWGGSDLGGLYCYRNNTWVKIGTYPDITFRHLVPSNIQYDYNVWATSIGKTGIQATSGGAYHIDTYNETVTQFGSGIAGGLGSRYGNSLAMSSQGEVFVALAQSTTAGITNQGGIYKNYTLVPRPPSTTAFIKAIVETGDIIYHSAGNRGDEMWFGKGADCSNGCKAPYITRLSSNGSALPPITNLNSPLPFTAVSTSAFARAIFTDSTVGNTFVGLNSGGIGVCRPDGTWKLLTSDNSPFPVGAAVNFNAIAEVYGEVWIGTTSGIFVYNGYGSLDDASSFKLLTTSNGLPSNSITDIAVDTARSQIWVTSSAGISRCPYTPDFIKGVVYNTFINKKATQKDSVPSLYSTLQKLPLTSGVKIRLLENGNEIETTTCGSKGEFELKKADDGKLYTVELVFESSSRKMKYQYQAIKNHTNMGAILFPDKLIDEIAAFKSNMAKRCFALKLPFTITVQGKCNDGFYTTDYEKAYEAFISPTGISENHLKRVQNIADYYVAMATVYQLGGSSTDLIGSAVSSAWDFVESLYAFNKFSKALFSIRASGELGLTFIVSALKINKEDKFAAANKIAAAVITDPKQLEAYKKIMEIMSDYADLVLLALEKINEPGAASKSIGLDITKRMVASLLSSFYYELMYCKDRHEHFISTASNNAREPQSESKYQFGYGVLFNPEGGSLVSQGNNILETKKSQIETYNQVAKYADATGDLLDAATALGVFPGGQLAAAIAQGLAVGAKAVKIMSHELAMLEAVSGGISIANLSNNILNKVGLSQQKTLFPDRSETRRAFSLPTQLINAKNLYYQSLSDLKQVYNAASYDSATYFTKLNALGKTDSGYTSEMTKALSRIWASADSGVVQIPGFSAKLNKVIDDYVTPQYGLRKAYFFQNIGYGFAPDKSGFVPELNNLTDSIKVLNDSVISSLSALIGDYNNYNVTAPANLVQDDVQINFSNTPGTSGSVIYKFTNYGGEAQQNVSFKIDKPTGGYTITSADSINVGTINPEQTKSITFNFIAPNNDSVGAYTISVKANNGKTSNVRGLLFAIDPTKTYSLQDGNWSNPKTWSNNLVPTATSKVEILHNITVDVNASCKTIRNNFPGTITVAPGKSFNVLSQ